MPDKRTHRGAHPEDRCLFDASNLPRLRSAVADLSWLLTRGYGDKSALKIVGDHSQLDRRQRIAVMRCACSDQSLDRRRAHHVNDEALDGATLMLDGYNVLTSVEAALADGAMLLARDGCVRDVASMHGSYRKVQETAPAISLIGEAASGLGVGGCHWYLDQPVSNSGRLKTIIMGIAADRGWDWSVQIVPSPDHDLIAAPEIVATADSVILDRCARWFNFARRVIESSVPNAWRVDLSEAD